ncbi:MAG: TetR/AcrR family transcriptional regulator [Actinomycetes bacterium]
MAESYEGRQRLSPELRQKLIVEAASRVLARNPDWTVEDVAEEAGVSDKLLYLYYPGGVLEKLVEAVAADFVAGVPRFFAGISVDPPQTQDELKQRIDLVVDRALDWVEFVPGAWMFGPERDRLSSEVGKLWAESQRSIAAMLAGLKLPGLRNTAAVRSLIHSELRAFEALAYDLRTGVLKRSQMKKMATARFEFLFTTAAPAISS